jgi:hypothetical protein
MRKAGKSPCQCHGLTQPTKGVSPLSDNSTYSDHYLRCLDAGLTTFSAAYAASWGEEMTVKAVAVIKADRARRAKTKRRPAAGDGQAGDRAMVALRVRRHLAADGSKATVRASLCGLVTGQPAITVNGINCLTDRREIKMRLSEREDYR